MAALVNSAALSAIGLVLTLGACGDTPATPASGTPRASDSATSSPGGTTSPGGCESWAISFAPSAQGTATPTEAIDAYRRSNPTFSDVPGAAWISDPGQGTSRGLLSMRAGSNRLEISRLEDGSWLVTAGDRC